MRGDDRPPAILPHPNTRIPKLSACILTLVSTPHNTARDDHSRVSVHPHLNVGVFKLVDVLSDQVFECVGFGEELA
jgi:hypothetical protein